MREMSRTVALVLVAASLTAPVAAEVVGAVEYYHQGFEHYFMTSNPAEIAGIDSGAVAGWYRTGQRFQVDNESGADRVPVCRFFSSAFGEKASHFFTASAAECELVKSNPNWTYEGVAFHARTPDAHGVCPAGAAPVYRAYNAGRGAAPNHAYNSYVGKRDTLVAAGWVPEGVAFCVPLAVADPVAKTAALASSKWTFPDIVYGGTIATTFQAEVITDGSYNRVFGVTTEMAPFPATIIHGNDYGVWWGIAGWLPLSGNYVVLGASGFEGWPDVAYAWEFDSAQGPTSAVCAMMVRSNVDSRYRRSEHPFQPYLLTGCKAAVANRL